MNIYIISLKFYNEFNNLNYFLENLKALKIQLLITLWLSINNFQITNL